MKLKNPIDAILDWYQAQADSIKKDIAFALLLNHPCSSFSIAEMADGNICELLEAWIIENKVDRGKYKQLAFALTIKALVDFFLIEAFGGQARWKELEELHKDIIETYGANPEFVKPSVKIIEKMPFRQRQWLKAGNQWNELCQKDLSPLFLRAWASGIEEVTPEEE